MQKHGIVHKASAKWRLDGETIMDILSLLAYNFAMDMEFGPISLEDSMKKCINKISIMQDI